MRHRQEVLNVLLAQCLQEEGLVADPEVILRSDTDERRMPDVVVDFRGLRMVIEGDFADTLGAHQTLLAQTAERVDTGLAHIGVAVLYPPELRVADFKAAPDALSRSDLGFAVVTEAERAEAFSTGSPHDLAATLRRVHEDLGRDRVLEQAVAVLEAGIEKFAASLGTQRAVVDRFAAALGIQTVGEGDQLTRPQRLAVRRIAGLILTNALIFHELLAPRENPVPPLQQVRGEIDVVAELVRVWRLIIEDINYYPIFHVSIGLLEAIARQPGVSEALEELAKAALRILSQWPSFGHDLMGRIYHRLLTEAKHLGAYYTSIPAATLLLKLTFRPKAWPDLDWADLGELASFTAADLACGTGTLLMATAEAITDNYIHACYQVGQRPDLNGLHRVLLRDILRGYDVLPSALHLTASTLAMRDPEEMVDDVNLFSLPLRGRGKKERAALGSLDYITGNTINGDHPLIFHIPGAVREAGRGPEPDSAAPLPYLNLCVMNPPFTRSVGGNLLFGSLPKEQRQECQKTLRQLIKKHKLLANTTAGLGSPFVATADRYMLAEGRVALVLPRAVLSGVAWGPTRELIESQYHLEYVVVSHEPNHWNFSENTDLSEALLIARRRVGFGNERGCNQPGGADEERTVFVNLWHNPRTNVQALSVARQTHEPADIPDLSRGSGAKRLRNGDFVHGEATSVAWEEVAKESWFFWCAFAQAELVRTFNWLRQGRLSFPPEHTEATLPLTRLDALGTLGPDRRDIHDGFEPSRGRTQYPAFWNHETAAVELMAQEPNAYLTPLAKAKPNRHLRKSGDLWPLAGSLLIAQRLGLNTARVAAVRVDREVLSNVWWPFRLEDSVNREGADKALVLWFNSTAGLLLLVGHRIETHGPWCQLAKPVFYSMPGLDVTALDDEQLSALAAAYDDLCSQPLLPLPDMADDPTRREIDEAIERALDLPDLTPLRESLSWEPVVCLTMDRLLANGGQ